MKLKQERFQQLRDFARDLRANERLSTHLDGRIVDELLDEIERLRAALAQYADGMNWTSEDSRAILDRVFIARGARGEPLDGYDLAREALEEA